jgi:hypothetical protein
MTKPLTYVVDLWHYLNDNGVIAPVKGRLANWPNSSRRRAIP